eukprot:SAG31_NODE_2381_length_5829_cov_4.002967_2_plen_78_part_00
MESKFPPPHLRRGASASAEAKLHALRVLHVGPAGFAGAAMQVSISQNISEYLRISQNISEYLRISQNISEYLRIYCL